MRKPAAGVTYFEIDDAATLAVKQGCYHRQSIGANVKFIPGNYVTDGLIDLLEKHGFDVDLASYFSGKATRCTFQPKPTRGSLRRSETG